MAAFRFKANKSFLTCSGHPITIPRGKVQYQDIDAMGLDSNSLTVFFPAGERRAAEIYRGVSGWGQYLQIHFCERNKSLPAYMKIGDDLLVVLGKTGGKGYVILEKMN